MIEDNNLYRKLKNIKSAKLMSPKVWSVAFVLSVILGLCLLSVYNYKKDPYFYFTDEFKGNWRYSHFYKARHILKNPDRYDCFIIGGSNSGAINPDLIEDYTGYNTYSYTFAVGNCYNYYDYVKFLIDKTDVKCIFLHLSSTEILQSQEYIDSDEHLKVPELVNGNALDILCEDFSFYSKSVDAKGAEDNNRTMENGQIDWSQHLKIYNSDPITYVNERVLGNYNDTIGKLGNVQLDSQIIEDNVCIMKEIKKLCTENDVELIVLCGPVFMGNRVNFECNAYYDYLEQLVGVVNIYDFSGFIDISMNPYNFYDYGHYSYEVADEMIRFMYGESELDQEFGILLTKDNIVDYIQDRKRDFEEKKLELQETGTIEYKGYDDPSRITGIEFE